MYENPFFHNREQVYRPYVRPTQSPLQEPHGYHGPMTPFDHFAKPTQPMHWPTQEPFVPYSPRPPFIPPQPQSSSILSQFQTPSGDLDINKMLSTVGQLANTVQQVSPVIKQVGSIIKSFR